jgi:hypothetical protein
VRGVPAEEEEEGLELDTLARWRAVVIVALAL